MSLAPTYEAIRHETSGKHLIREKPAEFMGTGHQCKDGYCHQLSAIFECVEIFIRIVGLYLGVVPPTCILVLSILWLFYSIIHCLMCVDTYSLNCIHFLLWILIDSFTWNEIVHVISCAISRWYHQYDAYSTPIRWSRVGKVQANVGHEVMLIILSKGYFCTNFYIRWSRDVTSQSTTM